MSENTRYLVWPRGLRPPEVAMPDEYALRTSRLAGRDREAFRSLVEDGGWDLDEGDVAEFRDRVLPGGCFVAVERATNAVVGTCSAVHNPRAGDHHFPFGGELAYLVVEPAHRREGVGRALAAAATRRLLDAGYDSVRAGVAADNLPAIRLYLNAGFAPFVREEGASEEGAPEDVGAWRAVFDRLGLPFDPERCVRA